MALLCDFRIATNDCTFRLPEANLGMLPAAGGSQTLSRIAGVPIASSMLLAGYAMNSEEAIRSGLVHKIVSGDNIMDESIELASKLANYPDRSMRAMKHAIRKGIDLPLESGLDLELNLVVALWVAADACSTLRLCGVWLLLKTSQCLCVVCCFLFFKNHVDVSPNPNTLNKSS